MIKSTFHRIGFSIILLFTVLSSCTQKIETTMTNNVAWEKMDVALRSELRANLEAKSDTTFVVLAEVTENNDGFESDLNTIDVVVQTRVGVIWTLSGNSQSLANASRKAFVKRLELSQKRRTS